jgi:hypothetical protein
MGVGWGETALKFAGWVQVVRCAIASWDESGRHLVGVVGSRSSALHEWRAEFGERHNRGSELIDFTQMDGNQLPVRISSCNETERKTLLRLVEEESRLPEFDVGGVPWQTNTR